MSFAPGDEVVCVDDSYCENFIRKGLHYVVRSVGVTYGVEFTRLVGVCEHEAPQNGFMSPRFRPVKREAIAIFRAMCVSTKPLVPVE